MRERSTPCETSLHSAMPCQQSRGNSPPPPYSHSNECRIRLWRELGGSLGAGTLRTLSPSLAKSALGRIMRSTECKVAQAARLQRPGAFQNRGRGGAQMRLDPIYSPQKVQVERDRLNRLGPAFAQAHHIVFRRSEFRRS